MQTNPSSSSIPLAWLILATMMVDNIALEWLGFIYYLNRLAKVYAIILTGIEFSTYLKSNSAVNSILVAATK